MLVIFYNMLNLITRIFVDGCCQGDRSLSSSMGQLGSSVSISVHHNFTKCNLGNVSDPAQRDVFIVKGQGY